MARDDDEPTAGSAADARGALTALGQIENQTERMLEAAAIIQEQLDVVGVSSTVVGGLAVAYWTSARYVTGGGDESDEIETPQGRKLTMLKAEDMALWRLREVVFWGAPDAIQQTLWLLEAPLLDRRRLEQRAHTEHLDGPLRELEAAAAAQSSAGVPFTDDELRELVVAMKRSYPLPT